MQVFTRDKVHQHCVGAEWPEFLGAVSLGESFVVETESVGANGPIEVLGVGAGDDIAVHIEGIDMEGPFFAPNGGPFIDGPLVPLDYRDGYFYFPHYFRIKANPSVGCVAVLPTRSEEISAMAREYDYFGRIRKNERGWRRVVRDARDKHSHQDCGALSAGATIHLKAQVDGVGLCLEDVHGYIGQGEMAFAAIEVKARVQLRVERSTGWLIDWPIIETSDEIMVFSSYSFAYSHRPKLDYVDVVREAYRAMCSVVADRIGASLAEANTIVATVVDIRNCALYGLRGFISPEKSPNVDDIAVVAVLRKDVFVGQRDGVTGIVSPKGDPSQD
jgi:acetamidase/formamidase